MSEANQNKFRKYDNPVDHKLDLGFVNYVQHPQNSEYIVYRFADEKRANDFEAELIIQKIWFEKGTEEKRSVNYILFGVHKTDFKVAQKINYSVEGKNKKPFIPVAWLRYFLLLFSGIVLTLAIMGYCEAQKKLDVENKKIKHEENR